MGQPVLVAERELDRHRLGFARIVCQIGAEVAHLQVVCELVRQRLVERALDALDAAAVAIPVMPPVAPIVSAPDSTAETATPETPATVAP